MKKLLLSLLASGLFAVPSLGHAATSPYVTISGGLGLLNNSSFNGTPDKVTYKTGYLINGAFGLKNDMYRLEAEVGDHSNNAVTWGGDPSTDKISIWSFMANGYLDFDMKNSGFSPFVMAGLGYAHATDHWFEVEVTSCDTVFAWQVGAGAGINVGNNATVDIGYRYFKPCDVRWNSNTYSLASSNIIVGIRLDL